MSIDVKVEITKDQVKQLKKRVQLLTLFALYVGVPDTNAARKPDSAVPGMKAYKGRKAAASQPTEPMNNATIAYIQNKGSPARNIPPRPFMTMGIEDGKARLIKMLQLAAQRVLDGELDDIRKGYAAAGLMLVNAIRKRMTDGPWRGLSSRTIIERGRRRKSGQAGTKPLIDTGQLRQAITFVTRTK